MGGVDNLRHGIGVRFCTNNTKLPGDHKTIRMPYIYGELTNHTLYLHVFNISYYVFRYLQRQYEDLSVDLVEPGDVHHRHGQPNPQSPEQFRGYTQVVQSE